MNDSTDKSSADRKKQIITSENKHQMILQKRNMYIEEAKKAREELDMLNKSKAEKLKELDQIKMRKRELREDFHRHVEVRNNYRKVAFEAIEKRKAIRKQHDPNYGKSISELMEYIKDLELRQQTVSMPIAEENKLIEELRKKTSELKEMEKNLSEHDKISGSLVELNKIVDENMKKADEANLIIDKLKKELDDEEEKLVNFVNGFGSVVEVANAKYKEYIEYVKKAKEEGKKAYEMRIRILTLKKGNKNELMATKREVEELNKSVDKQFGNADAINRRADNFLDELKKKGKINLR